MPEVGSPNVFEAQNHPMMQEILRNLQSSWIPDSHLAIDQVAFMLSGSHLFITPTKFQTFLSLQHFTCLLQEFQLSVSMMTTFLFLSA